jgi:hypothetical protein
MTPHELLQRIISIFPEFASAWDDPENCFRNDDGAFSLCGIFAEFSGFFRERFAQFTEDEIESLARLLDECMPGQPSDLDTAAATCFLENVAGEPFHAQFARHLRGEPLRYYQNW